MNRRQFFKAITSVISGIPFFGLPKPQPDPWLIAEGVVNGLKWECYTDIPPNQWVVIDPSGNWRECTTEELGFT
jgi:hypothetical protein